MIEAIRDHEALLAFNLVDEPTRKGTGPREIGWYGCWVQSLAPRVPVTENFCGPYTFERFATTTDVFSIDPYPVYTWGGAGHGGADLREVSQWNNLAQELKGENRGCITVIETFTFDKENKPPATKEELRNMVFQTLCGGITSIMYYSVRDAGWYLPDEPLFEALKEVNREVLDLEGWLIEGTVGKGDVPIAFSSEKPDEFVTGTWRGEGGWLTIVVNISRDDLDIEMLRERKITLAGGEGLPEEMRLKPLEVRLIEYNL